MNIQKLLYTALILVFFSTFSIAQDGSKGETTFQIGVGLVPTYFMDGSGAVVPPIQAAIDYKFLNFLSAGAFVGYSSYEGAIKENFDGALYQTNTKTLMGGVRLGAHATKIKNWDIYGGVQVGYAKPNVEQVVHEAGESRLPTFKVKQGTVYSGYLGAAGYITKNIGFYGEAGFGISLLKAGIIYKL